MKRSIGESTVARGMAYVCELCDHPFASRQSKCNHKRKFHKQDVTADRALAKEIERMRSAQSECKIETLEATPVHQFNINVFRWEETGYISSGRLRELNTSRDLNAALQELIRLIHFQKEHPENMNVFIPWEGADHAFMYGRQGWQRRDLQNVAKTVTYDAGGLMSGHVEDNDAKYSRRQVTSFDTWYDRLDKVASTFDATLKTIKANSQLVAETLGPLGALPPKGT